MVVKRDPRGRRKVLHFAHRDLAPVCGAEAKHGYLIESLLFRDLWPLCPRCLRAERRRR